MDITKEKRKLLGSMIYPFIILVVMWLVKLVETFGEYRFSYLGIIPLEWRGLPGLITAPLIHGDFEHLISNSVPFFLLSAGLFYFYDKRAFRIFLFAYFLPGVWVWLFARGNSSHIGASGVVYALVSFHIFSGLIKRQKQVLAFAMIVLFLYGSMVWGVFPDFFPHKNISWESHLMGGVAGLLLAYFFRFEGPRREEPQWEEHDQEWEDRIRQFHGYDRDEIDFHYHYKEKKDREDNQPG